MEKSSTVILRLEPELKARIDSGAKELGITRSEWLRRMLKSIDFAGTIKNDRITWKEL
jgi:antitoxin component of RelBE/YafQ-DinJ toxin-antitoxin module